MCILLELTLPNLGSNYRQLKQELWAQIQIAQVEKHWSSKRQESTKCCPKSSLKRFEGMGWHDSISNKESLAVKNICGWKDDRSNQSVSLQPCLKKCILCSSRVDKTFYPLHACLENRIPNLPKMTGPKRRSYPIMEFFVFVRATLEQRNAPATLQWLMELVLFPTNWRFGILILKKCHLLLRMKGTNPASETCLSFFRDTDVMLNLKKYRFLIN